MPTATTLPLIVLILLLWKLTKGELISMVLFVSIFGAASAIDFGSSGVAPWIFAFVLGILFKFVKGFRTLNLPTGINRFAVVLLAFFVLYAAITGLLFPFLFHGVLAWGSHDRVPSPLKWSSANANQLCYLLANITLFVIALSAGRHRMARYFDWYVYSCVFVSLMSFYQLANKLFGVPFPSAVLYSNPGYAIFDAYTIDSMWRLNSTFTEASAVAGYLSIGVALCGWDVLMGHFRWNRILSFCMILTALLLTLSSTGYLSLLAILAIGTPLYLRHFLAKQSIPRSRVSLLVIVVAVFAAAMVTTNLPKTMSNAIDTVLLQKKNSDSYKVRTAENDAALETAKETGYMGAGFGSVRCSGLLQGMLATVGMPGTMLFLVFLLSLAIPLRGYTAERDPEYVYARSLFCLLTVLAGMAVAGNEIVSPMLWVLFAASASGVCRSPACPKVFRRTFLGLHNRIEQGSLTNA